MNMCYRHIIIKMLHALDGTYRCSFLFTNIGSLFSCELLILGGKERAVIEILGTDTPWSG